MRCFSLSALSQGIAFMNLETFLVRQHWLKKSEFLTLIWHSVKGGRGETKGDYLEPSLREIAEEEIPELRPYPFGDVLGGHPPILQTVLRRSGLSSLEEVVKAWQEWHVEHIQPISDYSLSPTTLASFGHRLYENEAEKRLCAEYVAERLVQDNDHLVVPEGSSAFWVALTVLARRKKVLMITSNGALIRELFENPQLKERASSVVVVGGLMDIEVGGVGRGFIGEATRSSFELAVKDRPGATVVLSSVNGLLPEIGPYAPCPSTAFTRGHLLEKAFKSNVRKVVFIADHGKIRESNKSRFGNPIFNDKKEWKRIVDENRDRIAFVIAPPDALRNNHDLLSKSPRDRTILGMDYPKTIMEYLDAVKRFDEFIGPACGTDSRILHEVNPIKAENNPASVTSAGA
jgi:DeoR/GlpR family transcriptional regulator of sugar metabolism